MVTGKKAIVSTALGWREGVNREMAHQW